MLSELVREGVVRVELPWRVRGFAVEVCDKIRFTESRRGVSRRYRDEQGWRGRFLVPLTESVRR